MAKIAELTQAQIDRFPEFRDKWIEIGLCTDPANRKEAERGIQLAYKCAGLEPPSRIVWTTSPLSNVLTWALANKIVSCQSYESNDGKGVMASVENSVRESICDSAKTSVGISVGGANVSDIVWVSVQASVHSSIGASVDSSFGTSFGASVGGGVSSSVWDSVGDSIRASVWDSVGGNVGDSVLCLSDRATVWDGVFYGQHEPRLSFFDYFKEVCGLAEETSKLEGLWLIAKNAGWCLPHENICWISERHNILVRDDTGRLHCEDGPAIAYPDGWSIYLWHGIRVPDWIITNPEKVTIDKIHSETNTEWRRCMIERIGPENYLPKSGAEKVGTDECGTLWRRDFGDDVWCVVEVINGTREQDGSYKKYYLQVPPEMQTAREAVAWTYGLSENEYKVTLRT